MSLCFLQMERLFINGLLNHAKMRKINHQRFGRLKKLENFLMKSLDLDQKISQIYQWMDSYVFKATFCLKMNLRKDLQDISINLFQRNLQASQTFLEEHLVALGFRRKRKKKNQLQSTKFTLPQLNFLELKIFGELLLKARTKRLIKKLQSL